jgi:peptidoglycan hydrolase CwlO-like protein
VRVLALGVSVAAAVALPASGVGSSSPSTLRAHAQALTQQNAELASRSRSAVLTLYALDSGLARAQAQLDSLRAQSARLSRQRADAARALNVARRTFAASQRNLAERLRAVYEQGDTDELSIVLGAKTIDDALAGIETVNAATATDRTVVRQARSSRTRFLALQRKLAARVERLRRLETSVAATANALAAARAERPRAEPAADTLDTVMARHHPSKLLRERNGPSGRACIVGTVPRGVQHDIGAKSNRHAPRPVPQR